MKDDVEVKINNELAVALLIGKTSLGMAAQTSNKEKSKAVKIEENKPQEAVKE